MLYAGTDLPVIDFLGKLPYDPYTGAHFVCDPRGIPDANRKRYAYHVQASEKGNILICRFDLDEPAVKALMAGPLPTAGYYIPSQLAAIYDPNGGPANNTPKVYVLIGITAAPWIMFCSYDVATDAWDAALAVPALAASPTTTLSLTHTCTTLAVSADAGVIENYIFANGDGGVWGGVGISNIARYSKPANVWALLTGAGGARGGAPAAGSRLVWIPAYADRLYSPRGGGVAMTDAYNFAANSWSAPALRPNTLLCGLGTQICIPFYAPGGVLLRAGASNPAAEEREAIWLGSWFNVGNSINPMQQVARIFGDDGTAVEGQRMVTWMSSGSFYVGTFQVGARQLQRINIPSPI